MMLSIVVLIVLVAVHRLASALPLRHAYTPVRRTGQGDLLFNLGTVPYLANARYPKATIKASGIGAGDSPVPLTVVKVANATIVTESFLNATLAGYADDDVWSVDFLSAIYLVAVPGHTVVLDASGVRYLSGLGLDYLFLDPSVSIPSGTGLPIYDASCDTSLTAGPFLATRAGDSVSLSTVYRLYEDVYRNFLYGAYETNDGTGNYTSLDVHYPDFGYPAIPVPSRIYHYDDSRPLAGERVAIKDLFDLKGLKTTGGSRAWEYIISPANATAPSIQQIIDLGGVIVGKYKLAQFASGANPWDWQDEHYPFNPRGDGWLTCSASSTGGGCSIAAYDWLDFAIGSDTGSSMRRPAAVSGTYGQRPSQGMITLERVIPLGGATDTAGVFSRDPYKWAKFSKAWYAPSLFQSPNITGLSPLVVPDSDAFPKTILYPIDYLPLNNSAAEPLLDNLISNMTSLFGMTVKRFNFSDAVLNAPSAAVNNLTALNGVTLGVINSYSQWVEIGQPLTETWARLFDGRFPPIDPARRSWATANTSEWTLEAYNEALVQKRAAVDWYEQNIQYSTNESCSESVMLYDIGTGGLPSYREEGLNNDPDASFLAVRPSGASITGAAICPLYGCADFTIPIGQVPYQSQVTFHQEMVPVTINMVVKRGCDFVLLNMIERLSDAGVLKAVKTGPTAF